MFVFRYGCAFIFGLRGVVCRFFLNDDETMGFVHFGMVEVEVVEKPYVYVLPHVNHLPCLYICTYILTLTE